MQNDIPKINPNNNETISSNSQEEGSILVPKIDPEKNGDKGVKKKKVRINFANKKVLRIGAAIGSVLVATLVIFGLLTFRVYKQGMEVKASIDRLTTLVADQDLPKIREELVTTKKEVTSLQSSYKSVAWLKFVPYFGGFVSDGEHGINAAVYGLEAADIVIDTVEPYADIIGFSGDGEQAESPDETTQDRLDFLINTIPEVLPKADELIVKVKLIQEEVDYINPDRYPEKLKGFAVKEKVRKAKELVEMGANFVENGKPLLEVAPYILGVDGPRTYLVLFQNDKELRPTGGFMTAYSIAKVEKGKFEPVSSSDIYNLDDSYRPRITAPDPLIDYLKGPYVLSKKYRLRDLNWQPDFSESMKVFSSEAETVGIDDIDGIIAVDTQLLVYLLEALGPIGVPGYGNFSTDIMDECDCPQVIYELESFADVEGPVVWSENEPGKIVFAPPNYDNRKKIIGPLMNSILSNALGQSKEKLPALFEAGFKSLMEKHVLFYLDDEDAQKAVEEFGIAGAISDYEGDFLHINDANLGGRKSNLYVTHEVLQEVEIARDGTVEKKVTITYKNPKEFDGWLNSVLPNYVRVYVPKGSHLVSFDGVEDKEDPYEEFGKTVFAGFFELRPQGLAKVTLTYKLPFKVDKDYNLFVQKQPGKDAPLYIIEIGKKQEEFFLKTDKEFKFSV
jgi:hypothetical protein